MSFFRAIWRGNNSKHKKLYDEWALARSQDPELEEPQEEVNFKLKYIGSTLVDCAANEQATAEAVKTILNLHKAAGRKMMRVNVSVSMRGIKIVNLATNETQQEISIYRISYCSADAAHSQVFAFIATNEDETLECHAFHCPKRKVAQTVSVTVAQMFNTAFEVWQITQDQLALAQSRSFTKHSNEEKRISDLESTILPNQTKSLLIDLDCTTVTSRPNTAWVNFENDNTPGNYPNYIKGFDNGNINNFFPNNVNMWDTQRNLLCS